MFERTTLIARLIQANLLLHAVAYALMGLSGFLNPTAKLLRSDLLATTPSGNTTFRVIYGGLMLGIALTFAMSALVQGMKLFGLLALVAIMASLIATRTMGALLDRSFDAGQLVWSGIELLVLILSVYLYRASALASAG